MTPEDIELEHQAEAEGDIRWRVDRGWRIVEAVGQLAGWWWAPAVWSGDPFGPVMALTPIESHVWETMRTGPVALRPKETP